MALGALALGVGLAAALVPLLAVVALPVLLAAGSSVLWVPTTPPVRRLSAVLVAGGLLGTLWATVELVSWVW